MGNANINICGSDKSGTIVEDITPEDYEKLSDSRRNSFRRSWGPIPPQGERFVCPKGARCHDRSSSHLAYEAHPLDSDYIQCCKTGCLAPEPMSIKVVFDWVDSDGSGKISRDELVSTLKVISKLSGWTEHPEDIPTSISDSAWQHLDEDGNGVLNFDEFASWAGPRLGLPLGINRKLSSSRSFEASPCSVLGCPCEEYKANVLSRNLTRMTTLNIGSTCMHCKHKKHLHKIMDVKDQEIVFPEYWNNSDGTFHELVEVGKSDIKQFQQLLNLTYKRIFTRDREKHSPGCKRVPKSYKVSRVLRNENGTKWKEYYARRQVMLDQHGQGSNLHVFDDIKTMKALRKIGGAKASRLEADCNEWYLFHGTSPHIAQLICNGDFLFHGAGRNTGTLYGRGLYFAESITKADEYATPNDKGVYAVLLVRVMGGNVLYTDACTPDPEELVHNCVQGPYDSVLGDREKCRGTYREFVLFDSEDVFTEYVIEYTRVFD